MADLNKEQTGSLSTQEVRIINYQQYSISTLTKQTKRPYVNNPRVHPTLYTHPP